MKPCARPAILTRCCSISAKVPTRPGRGSATGTRPWSVRQYNRAMRALALAFLCLITLTACDMAQGWKLEKAVLDALAKDQRVAMSTFDVMATDQGVVTITG